MLDDHDGPPVSPPARDSIVGLDADAPTIVSISDIHGYVRDARSALLTLSDHPDFDPIVEPDMVRRLQWVGGEDYVLVFNGDLIDRGPSSDQVVAMVERLVEQAPPGHVRVTMGNHEMGVLLPDRFNWDGWYCVELTAAERRGFVTSVLDGHVVAAYEGYDVTYAHAGRPEPYEVQAINEQFVEATQRLQETLGTDADFETQAALIEAYPAVFGLGGRTGRGPGAGIAWLDFEYMPEDAPPQVVGHTRHGRPTRKGNVVCGNVIRDNRRSDGGEAVLVETPDRLLSLTRDPDGGVSERDLSLPEAADDS